MTWPTASARTKDWSNEILTDSDLEAQFDIIHDYINAFLDGTSGHDHSGADGYSKKIDLSLAVEDVLPVANGGTGLSTLTKGDIPYASAANVLSLLPAQNAGKALTTGGTGANPSFAGMDTGGDIEYHNGTTRVALNIGTSGKILQSNGSTPAWVSIIGTTVSKTIDTVYQADTDGFVAGYVDLQSGDQVILYTDSSSPPTTAVFQASVNVSGTYRMPFCYPIKRSDYYKLTSAAGTIDPYILNFIPIGA